jgi:hypothetical protein
MGSATFLLQQMISKNFLQVVNIICLVDFFDILRCVKTYCSSLAFADFIMRNCFLHFRAKAQNVMIF